MQCRNWMICMMIFPFIITKAIGVIHPAHAGGKMEIRSCLLPDFLLHSLLIFSCITQSLAYHSIPFRSIYAPNGAPPPYHIIISLLFARIAVICVLIHCKKLIHSAFIPQMFNICLPLFIGRSAVLDPKTFLLGYGTLKVRLVPINIV